MSKISYAKNDAEFLRCNELKLSRNSGLFQMILVKLDLKKTSYLAHVIFVLSLRAAARRTIGRKIIRVAFKAQRAVL